MIFGLYHHPDETAGLIIDQLKTLNLGFSEVHLYKGDALPGSSAQVEGLVVMGGPMNVDETSRYPYLLPELQLIQTLLREKKPVLGICLGAQLMAKALGENVFPNNQKEVGWHPIQLTEMALRDPLFKHLSKEPRVLHWHGDTFKLPAGAVRLATTGQCENQAFRFGENAYALQFHLEVTPSMLIRWCRLDDQQSFIKAAGESPDGILKETGQTFQSLEPFATSFFRNYLKSAYARQLAIAS